MSPEGRAGLRPEPAENFADRLLLPSQRHVAAGSCAGLYPRPGDVELLTPEQRARARPAGRDGRSGSAQDLLLLGVELGLRESSAVEQLFELGELSVRIGGLLSRGVLRGTDLLLRWGLCSGCLLLLLLMLAVLMHGVRAARDGGGTTAPLASI